MTSNLCKYFRAGAAMLLVLICDAGFSQAQTQTTNATPQVLTLEDAVNYALEHYPAVRASLEQVSAARAGVSLARTQYLPQLNGAYQISRATQNQVLGIWLPTPITPTVEGPLGSYSGDNYWGSQAAALFSWEPLDFGLRSAKVGQAQAAEAKSQSDLALTKLQVATAIGNYFLLVVANQQAVQAARANVERWEVFGKSIHVLVDNDLRPGADASRADAELAGSKARFYEAQQAERVALDTLSSLLGAAGKEIKVNIGSLLNPPKNASLPESAVADHPLARDQMASVQQVQAEEKMIQRKNYPRLFLQAEAFGRGSGVPTNGEIVGNWSGAAPARGNWVTGITVLFPDVFAFKARSAEEQISKASELSQEARYDRTIQDLTGQLQVAHDQLKGAELVAQETPTELTAARQTETQSRARYQAGLTTITEVAEAENLLVQAEMDEAVAHLNVWRGLFNVSYAQGDLQNFLRLLNAPTVGDH